MAIIRQNRTRPISFYEGSDYEPRQIDGYVAVPNRRHPWATLGTDFNESEKGKLLTADEALGAAGVNYTVDKLPLYLEDGTPVPKMCATGYTDENGERHLFAAVSDKYKVVQPVEACSFFDNVLDAHDGAHYSSAWSMREKAMMGVTIEFPEEIVVDPKGANDRTALHGLGVNTFDGSGALSFSVIATRWFCMNQLSAALRGAKAQFRLKHTSGVAGKVAEAREALGITFAWAEEFDREANRLYEQAMTDRQFENLVKRIGPFELDGSESDIVRDRVDARRTAALETWRAPHNENVTGTRWGAYNVLAEYADWGRRVVGSPRTGTTPERQRAIGTMVSPHPEKVKLEAWDRLVAMR